jgi:hypothetical protein
MKKSRRSFGMRIAILSKGFRMAFIKGPFFSPRQPAAPAQLTAPVVPVASKFRRSYPRPLLPLIGSF